VTLVLAAVVQDTAFMVGDQLAVQPAHNSSPRMRPFYPLMNKAVVFRGSDGLVAIGVSGRAYLEGRPIDQWIAERLTGADDLSEGAIIFRVGGVRKTMNVYEAAQTLRSEAERSFAALHPKDRCHQSFAITGWQRRRKNGAKRLLWRIDNANDAASFEMVDLLRDTPDSRSRISFTPIGVVIPDAMDQLLAELQGASSAEQFERRLVHGVRSVSKARPDLVGANCVGVRLRPHQEPHVIFRYHPSAELLVPIKTAGPVAHPVMFTPWVISHGQIAASNVLVGSGGRFAIGGLWYEVVAPRLPDPTGPAMFMDRLPVPRDPQRRS
jgi:hypothetical protein